MQKDIAKILEFCLRTLLRDISFIFIVHILSSSSSMRSTISHSLFHYEKVNSLGNQEATRPEE
ncbi:hypothetical protein NC653_040528 [Populus alba x Populus x berolinensis]|uniref:Uncharacterized protein n=1 Tax=Populus alba x Populus x berolinensis TaxID=444605 RepID=A0AAD6PNZ2_9ROSI|nr:hypothetical protein NC653_040528 [Populus alba x Populus x berolinensis]